MVISVENFSAAGFVRCVVAGTSGSESNEGGLAFGGAANSLNRVAPRAIRTGGPVESQSAPCASTWSTCPRNAGMSTRNAASIVG